LNLLIGEETSSTMIPLAGQHVAEEEEEIDGFTQSEATLLYLILQVSLYFHFGILLGPGFSKSNFIVSGCRL
jgi:hypothetical protein